MKHGLGEPLRRALTDEIRKTYPASIRVGPRMFARNSRSLIAIPHAFADLPASQSRG